jgi:hypothetical protein
MFTARTAALGRQMKIGTQEGCTKMKQQKSGTSETWEGLTEKSNNDFTKMLSAHRSTAPLYRPNVKMQELSGGK